MRTFFIKSELNTLMVLIFLFFSCSNEEINNNPEPEKPEEPGEEIVEVLPLDAPVIDNTTLIGKAMFGYQGWFSHPDAPNTPFKDTWHWGTIKGELDLEVEMFPDYREFCSDEKYSSDLTYPNGEMVPFYSASNERTVLRHMKWLRDYHLDGVFLQRFITELTNDDRIKQIRDLTTRHIIKGCEKYGRVFALMYDGCKNNVDDIINDWKYMVDNLNITDSERYLYHDGLPLLSIYGYTVYDGTAESLKKLMDFFTDENSGKYRASVMLVLNDNWFEKDEEWKSSFKRAKIISQWPVGRFSDISSFRSSYMLNQFYPAKSWCDENNVIFYPIVYPGFSWTNLKDEGIKNQIPRNGGSFMWSQVYSYIENGVKGIFLAMFDEVDEGTSCFKMAENASMAPQQGWWLNLDADGYKLPSDWYLRIASKVSQVLKDKNKLTINLETPPLSGMAVYPQDEKGILLKFPDFPDFDNFSVSVDNGQSWPYTVEDNTGEFFIELSAGTYEIIIRQGEKDIPMGEILLN